MEHVARDICLNTNTDKTDFLCFKQDDAFSMLNSKHRKCIGLFPYQRNDHKKKTWRELHKTFASSHEQILEAAPHRMAADGATLIKMRSRKNHCLLLLAKGYAAKIENQQRLVTFSFSSMRLSNQVVSTRWVSFLLRGTWWNGWSSSWDIQETFFIHYSFLSWQIQL